jgi:hypothetical protein
MPTLEELYPGQDNWFRTARAAGLTDDEIRQKANSAFGAAPATQQLSERIDPNAGVRPATLGRATLETARNLMGVPATREEAVKRLISPTYGMIRQAFQSLGQLNEGLTGLMSPLTEPVAQKAKQLGQKTSGALADRFLEDRRRRLAAGLSPGLRPEFENFILENGEDAFRQMVINNPSFLEALTRGVINAEPTRRMALPAEKLALQRVESAQDPISSIVTSPEAAELFGGFGSAAAGGLLGALRVESKAASAAAKAGRGAVDELALPSPLEQLREYRARRKAQEQARAVESQGTKVTAGFEVPEEAGSLLPEAPGAQQKDYIAIAKARQRAIDTETRQLANQQRRGEAIKSVQESVRDRYSPLFKDVEYEAALPTKKAAPASRLLDELGQRGGGEPSPLPGKLLPGQLPPRIPGEIKTLPTSMKVLEPQFREPVVKIPQRLSSTVRKMVGSTKPGRFLQKINPRSEEYAVLKTQLGNRLAQGVSEATRLGAPIKKLPHEVRVAVADLHTGRRSIDDFDPGLLDEINKGLEAAEPAVKLKNQLHRELVDRKILSPETGEKYDNKYFRRQYLRRLAPGWEPSADVAQKAIDYMMRRATTRGRRMSPERAEKMLQNWAKRVFERPIRGDDSGAHGKLSSLFERMNIPEPVRDYFGEVRDVYDNTLFTVADQQRLVHHHDFFRQLSDMREDLLKASPDEVVRLNIYAPDAGFKLYGDHANKIMGDIGHKPIPRWFADDLVEQGNFMSEAAKALRSLMSVPKRAMTVWNSPTHFGNMFGNGILSVFSGNSVFNPRNLKKFWIPSIGEYFSRGKWVNEMVDTGALGPGFITREGREFAAQVSKEVESLSGITPSNFLVAWNKVKTTWKAANKPLDFVYEAEDNIPKVALYIKARTESGMRLGKVKIDRVMTPDEAAVHVNRYFPSFDWRGTSEQKIQKHALGQLLAGQFASFPIQLTRIGGNIAKYRPLTAAMMAGGVATLANYGMELTDIPRNEVEAARDNLPLYMRERLLIPYRVGKTGNPRKDIRFFDLTHKMPFASMIYGRGVGYSWYQSDPTDEGWQVTSRVAHALNPFVLSRLARHDVGDEEKMSLSTAGNVARQAYKTVVPSFVQKLVETREARRAGKTTNRYNEPLPTTAQILTGTTPVYASGNRKQVERKRLIGEFKKKMFKETLEARNKSPEDRMKLRMELDRKRQILMRTLNATEAEFEE